MKATDEFPGMKLTAVLAEWMRQEGWDDDIEVDAEDNSSRVVTSMGILDQRYQLFFEVNEAGERFHVYLYTPFRIPTWREPEFALLANRINARLGLGRIIVEFGEARPVQFMHAIDVEGGQLAPQQIGTMLGAATGTFRQYAELLSGIAFTRQSADVLWAQFIEEQEMKEEIEAEAAKLDIPEEDVPPAL